ncbi:Clp protease N-terminal domain-containing protein [Kitasatospora sp. NPDC088346]|uniref:Clp protease N-terminal domain-containing protein n=1 Tax=Kitasatospora sp. NPDC088346 TaxID=3364073 RepID=UPI00382A4CB8
MLGQEHARLNGLPEQAPLHLALGLLDTWDGRSHGILTGLGVDPQELHDALEPAPAVLPAATPGPLGMSAGARGVLERACWEAASRRTAHCGTEHLLLALLSVEESALAAALARCDITATQVRSAVNDSAGPQDDTPARPGLRARIAWRRLGRGPAPRDPGA